MMPATIQDRCAPYRAELDVAYAAHPEIPPGTLEAIGDRETLWGWAPEYRLADGTQAQGRPDGTGDWVPRSRVPSKIDTGATRLHAVGTGKDGLPTWMPADGLGWGRGLMQIDLAAHPEFCAQNCMRYGHGSAWPPLGLEQAVPQAWACARCNITYAAGVLATALKQSSAFGVDATVLAETICSYNAGWRAVLRARTSFEMINGERRPNIGHLDAQTTGGSYVSDVLRRRDDFMRMCSAQPPVTGKDVYSA